jgi:amino acid adenylation domain-containing protein
MNRGARPELCAPALVSRRARLIPTAAAVTSGAQTITYEVLEARSNALGAHLRSLGVARDVVVGLCMQRSVAFVVGALGIMKAGGAYLPLDPSHPADRLAFQLDDAGGAVIVSAESGAARAGAMSRRIVPLADDGTLLDEPGLGPAQAEVRPEDLAYVIYTSGSTGRPKGVEITHAGLANLIEWHCAAFAVTENDRASHLAAVSFDAAVWELWPYLAVGASVHVGDDTVSRDPAALKAWLLAEGITIGFVPTPTAERLMEFSWPPETPLKIVLTGADRLRTYAPPAMPFHLVNNYGPTECTVVATSGVVPVSHDRHGLPPIGYPIANATVYVVDDGGRLVPPGEEGEIWIGGRGVARGYRNLAALTAEKFLPNPFDPADGGRVYRTGDLGRVLPDGQIAFVGRIDEQIKIRGFRVEPGEVETVLDEHPAVRESAVVVRDVGGGNWALCAYVVPAAGTGVSAGELRGFAAKRLPEYMIPTTFAALTALPLNASGKIDRSALRSGALGDALRDVPYALPTTMTEDRLVRIVGLVLNLDRVSVDDDFFQLGGHSLLGTQLIARLYETFGVNVGLRALFGSPTIAALAAEVDRLREGA